MSRQTYGQAMSEGNSPVKKRLREAETRISLVEERGCFYDFLTLRW